MKIFMGISILFLILSLVLQAFSQVPDTTKWVRIDCGSTSNLNPGDGIHWLTDTSFINTGTNSDVSPSSRTKLLTVNTLRFFPDNIKNCYKLPAQISTRYFIRTVFYYGDYDGLSNPPTFNLQFDGNDWATVVTSMSDIPQIYEVIYIAKSSIISVCLIQTQEDEFPLISVLELWPLPDKMYEGMSIDGTSDDVAWFADYRYCFGGTDDIFGYPTDAYNRIWVQTTPDDLIPVNVPRTSLRNISFDYPPDSVMANAVEAPNRIDSISLTFTFESTNRINYVVIYFTELFLQSTNDTRMFYFYVNGQNMLTLTPEYEVGGAAWCRGQFVGNLSIELRPTMNSTLPPLINAIEVYSASDPLVPPTSPEDHKGKKLGLIIGLAVGLPVALLLVIVAVYFLARKQANTNQGQQVVATGTELSNSAGVNDQGKPQEEVVSVSISAEQQQQPSKTNVQVSPIPSAPYAGIGHHENENQTTHPLPLPPSTVNANADSANYPHEVSNMDMEELNELLQRHGSTGVSGRI